MTVIIQNPMQRDIELFEEFDLSQKTESVFFFYTWDRPAITLGKAQRERQQIMTEAAELGMDCFLRPTGGKAVLHGGDICYTFIGAQTDAVYGGKLRESFKSVNQMVIRMVNETIQLEAGSQKLEAASDLRPQTSSQNNCFHHAVCNEGIYADHKIVGAAQAMGKRAFIQQGSIQLNKPSFELESLKANTSLAELRGQNYDLEKITEQLNQASLVPFVT